jgi:acyl-CoA reductase-like NAD-dependent aldehyde dehydrogenase
VKPGAAAATAPPRLDEAVERLRVAAPHWVKLPLDGKLALARTMLRGVGRVAARSVEAACLAKGIPPGTPLEGEEWLSGPYATLRILRGTIRSLEALSRGENTPLGRVRESHDGRAVARIFPATRYDAALFRGVAADVRFEPGVRPADVARTCARFHKQPWHDGRVCLVLGAGNVNSIPAADVTTKLFNEGKVCLLKMNPVNAYVGPLLEEAFAEAISLGFLRVVYGGGDEGAYLARHPGVDEIHITGSDRTHDLIVWGPPGPERQERKAANRPLLDKEITSELGNVSPVLVVPGPYRRRELEYQAESVAGMVTNNASFNCNAAKMLVTPRGWKRRDAFLGAVMRHMSAVPPRRAWYPGAAERYSALTAGRSVLTSGGGPEGTLPWTLLSGLDPASADEPAFRTEPFCAILSETQVGDADPLDFLDAAVRFANERLWGTLNAALVVHPATLKDRRTRAAVQHAVAQLRYGTVAVNVWPAYGYAFGVTPWGGHPSATLRDIQSGRGFVHNTSMLERVEKTVVWAPLTSWPKPPYFPSHGQAHRLGRALTRLEETGSPTALPAVLAAAVRG